MKPAAVSPTEGSPGAMDTDAEPHDDAATVWTPISGRVTQFLAAWESGQPPSIGEFLDGSSPEARRSSAVELIKLDLEQRRQRRKATRTLEDYFTEFPFLADNPPPDLIYEDCRHRVRAGETFDVDELSRRFPSQAAAVRRMLESDAPPRSTSPLSGKLAPAARLVPGERVEDFQLIAPLGEGAFGTVYLARQTSMQRLVALKVSNECGDEPQTLAQFDHENIIRVYDQRRLPDRGLRLMYMQFAAGGTLEGSLKRIRRTPIENRSGGDLLAAVDAVLASRSETPPEDSPERAKLSVLGWPQVVCKLGAQLARALDYAHHAGVLHRDIKPANVLLTSEGVPKLADFNISYSSKIEGATAGQYFGGSLPYMSPEQLEACNPEHARTPESLDARSDLYSLGVVLWELLIGERPFHDAEVPDSWSNTLAQMAERRRMGPSLNEIPAAVDAATPGLRQVLARCLAAESAERFPNGLELARHLEYCLLPRTQYLLTAAERPAPLIARYPLPLLMLLMLFPNAVAGAFNYYYNHAEIVANLPDAEAVFQRTQTVLNGLLFPLGLTLAALRFGPRDRLVADPVRRRAAPDEELAAARRRILFQGHDAALIGVALWIFAGAAYPLLMYLGLGRGAVETMLHFFTSLALCGLVAGTYPYWLVTPPSVRFLYPRLILGSSLSTGDGEDLERLRRLGWAYLGLTALVPMTAVAILAISGSTARYALVVSAVVGIFGFGAALLAMRQILGDVEALKPLVKARRPTRAIVH